MAFPGLKFFSIRPAGPVLHITINRPEVRNALHAAAYHELSLILDEFESDDTLLIGVLSGAGSASFCAGRDLKDLARLQHASDEELEQEKALWHKTTRLTDRFELSKPLIAKLNGPAYGGGFELALACDIIIAADHVEMALPEPRRGLIAMAGGVHRLPRQIGTKVAMGYLLTGRSLSAQRAYELGLVNQVVPAAELDEAVEQWLADMLLCAPLALRSTKQCAMQGLGLPLSAAMSQTYEWEEKRKASADALEGPRAFSEKRKPNWTGR